MSSSRRVASESSVNELCRMRISPLYLASEIESAKLPTQLWARKVLPRLDIGAYLRYPHPLIISFICTKEYHIKRPS